MESMNSFFKKKQFSNKCFLIQKRCIKCYVRIIPLTMIRSIQFTDELFAFLPQ